MKSLETKILSLGREGNFKGIQKLIDDVQVKEICSLLQETLKHVDGLLVLSFLLKGFSENGPSTMKRLQVTEFILEELHGRCIQSQHAYNIVALLITELDKYPTSHLIKIHDLCMEYMQKNSLSGSSFWKDLLPKIIAILSEKDSIVYAGSEMPGSEFKEVVVEKLCRIHWKGEKIASVVSLLTDLSLNEKDQAHVVVKVGKWLQDLKAPEVPPLAHQLFRLCHRGANCTLTIFLHLRDYFSKNLYCREKQTASSKEDSESIFSEIDCETYGPNSLSEMRLAEGTVLYHVEQAASLGSPLVQNLLNSLKGIINEPELILDPFIITVLLHLSSVTMYQNQILDILWLVIKCCIEDEEGKIESAWLREMMPMNVHLDSILTSIVENSASGRDRVTSGLMSLGIKLLSVPLQGQAPPSQNAELVNPEGWIRHCSNTRERLVQRAWHLGSTLLLLMAKRVNSMATPVLKTILSNIIAGKTPTTMAHLTGCLAKMCSSMPLMMLENQSILIEKMSSLMLIGNELNEGEEEGLNVCLEVVDAILPLVKISSYIRDSLVLIMRKSMFSRSIKSREVAVTGFLHMLKYLKVEEFGALSQSSQNTYSGPSSSDQFQANVFVHSQAARRGNTNESTYLEILNVVRRCLVLQPEVRKCLYEGFPSAINQNPELGSHLLEFLYHHLVQFLIDLEKNVGDQLTSPLEWSKIVRINGKEACLKEPIASLIWCTQLLLLSGCDSDHAWPSESDAVLAKVKKIMKALVEQVGKCAPSDYGLEETYDFTAASTETEEKKIIIRQLFGVHEALISYIIGSWRKHLNEPGENLISLMNAHSRLEVFVSRIKLADTDTKGRKKKGKENGDPLKKPSANVKSAAQLIPDPVLDPHCTLKFLKLLFNDVSEMDMESVSTKTRQNLHTFVIKAALHHIHQARVKNFYHRQRFSAVKHCYEIICIIYKNCIANLLEYAAFHKNCALLALECLCEIVALDTNYHKLAALLDEEGILDDTDIENEGSPPLKKCIYQLQSLLELLIDKQYNEEEVEKDAWFNMPFLVISCIAYLSSQLLPSSEITVDSTATHPSEKLLDWIGCFSKEKKPKNPKVAKLALSHLFVLGNRCHYSALELPFESIIKQLGSGSFFGRVDEAEEEASEFKILTDATKTFAFSLLCTKLKIILEETDRMLKRLKSECYRLQILNEPISGNATEKLTESEREVCTRLIHCGQIANKLSQLATSTGSLHAILLKLFVEVYNSVIQITRYFIKRSHNRPSSAKPAFDGTRFEKLVQLVGTHLSSNVSQFRTHIQDVIEEEEKKKKKGAKSQHSATIKSSSLLVYTTEIFEKFIIQLSKRTKVNLSAMVKLSTSRDFRIDPSILEENLKSLRDEARGSDENDDNEDENNIEEEQENVPVAKKARFRD